MVNIRQQVALQGQSDLGECYNEDNPTAQVVYMAPASAEINKNPPIPKRINKTIMLILSAIQLANAAFIITIQLKYPYPYIGTSFWCGIIFVISGILGMIARAHPGTATIVTLMVFNIIAAIFCLPLFIASLFAGYEHTTRAILMLIVLVQLVTAIASSAMACKGSCCCRPTLEEGMVYYANNGGREGHNPTAPSPDSPLQHPGYVTSPINQIPLETADRRLEALPDEVLVPRSNTVNAESPPPTYESVTKYESNHEACERVNSKKE
jgi:hypothetical protein